MTALLPALPMIVNASLRSRWSTIRLSLGDQLFPDAPMPEPRTWRRAVGLVLVALGLTAAQLARLWPSRPLNSIWAEDGTQWLTGALSRTFSRNLTTTYNGYLQTISRILAKPISHLPVRWYAAGMAISGVVVVTGCALIVWYASAGHVRSRHLRAALAGSVVLLSVAGVEMLANVTNTIWYLIFATFWLLLWRPRDLSRACGAGILVLLSTLSTAGVVFLAPLWFLRLISTRDRRDVPVLTALPLGLAVQLLALTTAGQPAPHWSWSLLPAYIQRVGIDGFVGQTISGDLWRSFGVIAEIVGALILTGCVLGSLRRRRSCSQLLMPLAVLISLVMFIVSGYQRNVSSALLWPSDMSSTIGSRYVVVPTLILISALVVWLDEAPVKVTRLPWPRVKTGAAAVLIITGLLSFNIGDRAARGQPTWTTAVAQASQQCRQTRAVTVPIAVSPPDFGALTVACRQLP